MIQEPVVLRYSKKWFNPLYFELRKYIDDPTVRQILVYGGKSSSKTISICQVLAEKAVSQGKSTLAFRKESTLIPTTLKPSFSLAIESHRLHNAFTSFDRWFKTQWGASIVLKGLDKEEKVKGTEGFHYLYFDELNHFTKDEFDQANLSLRGQENQKIIASWNPVNVNSWVKKDFLDKYQFDDMIHSLPCSNSFVRRSKNGKIVLIKTTYEDNFWIAGSPNGTYGYKDQNIIDAYNELKDLDENSYNVNVLGEWGIDDPNKLFAKDYSHAKHFGKSFKELYQKDLEIFLSWDFNVDNTCLAIQNPGNAINVLREYHIKGYDLEMLCALIKKDFPGHEFIINGDASGRNKSAFTSGNATAYDLLHSHLDFSWDYQFFVRSTNPSHLNSRLQTNVVLKYYEVNISEECKELDMDLRSVEVDDNGSIDPYKKKNNTRSHWMDCFEAGTKIETINGPKNIEEIQIGDLVLTRKGYKKVIDQWDSMSETSEYSINGTQLFCTNDHKIFTENKGFLEAKHLKKSDIFCKLIPWKESQLSSMASYGIDTQNPKEGVTGFTIAMVKNGYMFINGNTLTDLFPKDLLSIIKMSTHSITTLKTWSVLSLVNTFPITSNQIHITPLLKHWNTLPKSDRSQNHGMDLQRGWSLIEGKSLNLYGKTINRIRQFASNVLKLTKPKRKQDLGFAPTIARQHLGDTAKKITFPIPVLCADQDSPTINTIHESIAQEIAPIKRGLQKVYDITVEDEHEFFANGILVHNCFRYHLASNHKDKTR